MIAPEATPADARVSCSVCTVMPFALFAAAVPIVRPLRVMVKAAAAGIPATAVAMTIAVAVGWAEVAVMVETDVVPAAFAAGVADVAKNPDGKLRVIFPLVERAAWVVKARVTGTPALAATRWPAAMVNVTEVA